MKDKKKIKRRTYLDIGKREKVKDYKDKRTKDGERFQENIVEKKSKLNNFEREIKSTDKKGGLSLSQKQIEKHRAKEERTGDSNNLEKITTESRQVKEVIIEEKNLDIGARVMALMSRKKNAVVCHGSIPGNQYCTYTATAVSSDMPTSTYSIQ